MSLLGLELLAPFGVHRKQAVDWVTLVDHPCNELLCRFLRLGLCDYLFCHRRRNHQDTVGAAVDDVAGLHCSAAARDGLVDSPGNMQSSEHCRVAAAVECRNTDLSDLLEVAHAAVGDDAGRPETAGAEGEDVAEGS